MKLAIMQPYLFPYIGYFQLMNAVDEFVVYDNIEFTKKGWINRNRILVNGKDDYISFPLKKDSDFLHVMERQLADIWPAERKKMINRIRGAYQKAPFFETTFDLVERILLYNENNLFTFIFYSLEQLKNFLGITTNLVISSSVPIDHTLKGQEKVIAICKARNATTYINPIGGLELYSKSEFKNEGIQLQFSQPDKFEYPQFGKEFVPWLSIIDVMMFNAPEKFPEILNLNTVQ